MAEVIKIQKKQLEEARSRLPEIVRDYGGSPKIRFQTGSNYVVEIEHVDGAGEIVLGKLEKMAEHKTEVVLTVGEQTGKATGNQFHLLEVVGNLYALVVEIRDSNATNVIPRF